MWVTFAAFLIAGLLGGSFVNVVIHRGPVVWGLVPRESSVPEGAFDLARPRSHCPSCGRTLGASELVPILSYLAQRGRCRGCGAAIAARYPAVEAAGALAGALAWAAFGPSVVGGMVLSLFLILLAAAVIDARTGYLPDALTVPAVWLGLLASALGGPAPPAAAIIGAALGYSSFRLLADGYEAVRGREGLGLGDAKLLAAGGAWLGPFALPVLVLAAALAALAVVGASAVRGARPGADTAVRFGPYLAGTVAALVVAFGLAPALASRVVPAWPFP